MQGDCGGPVVVVSVVAVVVVSVVAVVAVSVVAVVSVVDVVAVSVACVKQSPGPKPVSAAAGIGARMVARAGRAGSRRGGRGSCIRPCGVPGAAETGKCQANRDEESRSGLHDAAFVLYPKAP